jgi:N-acetylglucosaminyldiphosphoundecaprenol N-acetyl-beta-D-mannosaminyltransferase
VKKKRLKKPSERGKTDVKSTGVGDNLFLSYWKKFVMATEKDRVFKDILKKTSLNVVDGIGLVWARELDRRSLIVDRRNLVKKIILAFKVGVEVLKGKHKEQISSGADLILDLAKMAKEKNKKIFLLGGWGDRAEKTANFLVTKNLDRRSLIVDRRNELKIDWNAGEPEVSNDEVIRKINKFKPDILLVAYGMKKQEFWIDKNLEKLDVGLVMGVGRSFDYYSGDLKRAPKWLRKMGMEWLYSLIKEPKRFKRQLALPKFVWKVLQEK